MSKRNVLFIDSPVDENLYYYLCVNIPSDLSQDLLAFEQPLLQQFEQYFYAHKNDIKIKYFIADKLFVGFIGFFANLFHYTNTNSVREMNDILEGVFQKHSKKENNSVINEHDTELLLLYLSEIEKGLSYLEGENVRSMIARCHDLKNDILTTQIIKYPSYGYTEKIIFSYGNRILHDALEQWMEGENELIYYRNIHCSDNQNDSILSLIENNLGKEAPELDVVSKVAEEMSQLINKVIYEYDTLTIKDKDDFKNLWYFIVSIQYLGLIPSSFFEAVGKIVFN